MVKDVVFYICETCGNIVAMIRDSGINPVCCGSKMKKLVPGEMDAATEKHVPVVTVEGNTVLVKIGSVPHPMKAEHLIEWVYVQTEKGTQRKALKVGDAPEISFTLDDDTALAVYAYCNIHGLWKASI